MFIAVTSRFNASINGDPCLGTSSSKTLQIRPAIGFKSFANAAHPSRSASDGIVPPPRTNQRPSVPPQDRHRQDRHRRAGSARAAAASDDPRARAIRAAERNGPACSHYEGISRSLCGYPSRYYLPSSQSFAPRVPLGPQLIGRVEQTGVMSVPPVCARNSIWIALPCRRSQIEYR